MAATLSDIQLNIIVSVANMGSLTALSGALTNVNKVMDNTRRAQEDVGKATNPLLGAFQALSARLSGAERAMDAVFRAGVHLQALGRDLMGFAKSVVGSIGDMVDAWGKFEFSLNRAASASDIFTRTAPMYEKLKQAIFDATHEMRVFPAEDVAKATYFWQSATGQVIKTEGDLKIMMAGVTAAMKAAAITGTSFETAIKGIYSILVQYHLPLSNAADVTAKLMLITQKTALEFPDLINAFKMVGPVARSAGATFEDITMVLGRLGDAGIRGSQAGRALRQFFRQIVKPSKEAAGALKEVFADNLGKSYEKLVFPNGKFIGLTKYVNLLAKATKNMTQEERNHLIAMITTANEMPVLQAMLDDARNGYDKTKYSLAGATEAFNKTFESLSSSWRGVSEGLKNTLGIIVLEIGQKIATALTPFVNALSDALWGARDNIKALADSIIAYLTPALNFLIGAFMSVLEWAKKNSDMVAELAKWGVIAVIFAGVAGAVLLAVGTFLFLLSSVVLLVAGVAPMVAVLTLFIGTMVYLAKKVADDTGGILTAMSKFKDAIVTLFDRMTGGGDKAADAIKRIRDQIDKIVGKGMGLIADGLNSISDALNGLTDSQVKILTDIVTALGALVALNVGLGVSSTVLGTLAGPMIAIGKAGNGMGSAIPLVKNLGLAIATILVPAFGALISTLIPFLIAAAPVIAVILALAAAVAIVVLAYTNNFMGFADFINGLVAQISDWINRIFGPVVVQLGETAAAIGQFISDVGKYLSDLGLTWQGVGFVIGGVLAVMAALIGTTFGVIADLIRNAAETIATIIRGVSQVIQGIFQVLSAILTGNWSKLWEGIKNILGGTITIISGFLTGFLGFVKGIVEGVGKAIFTIIDMFSKDASAAIKAFWGAIAGLVSWLYGNVERFVGGIIQFFTDTVPKALASGKAFLVAVWEGFKSFVSQFSANITNFITGLVKPFTDVAAKMIEAGKNIVRGIWQGVQALAGWLSNQVSNFIYNTVVKPIQDALKIFSPSKVMAGIGVNVVKGLAEGILKSKDAYLAMDQTGKQLSKMAVGMGEGITLGFNPSIGGTLDRQSTSTRNIMVQVDVTSKDGSVDKLTTAQLRQSLLDSGMVRAIEQMATVS